MSTIVPNLVTVSQPAAELLRFVEKFKMAAYGGVRCRHFEFVHRGP